MMLRRRHPRERQQPRLGSEAIVLPRSDEARQRHAQLDELGVARRTPLIAISPIFIAKSPRKMKSATRPRSEQSPGCKKRCRNESRHAERKQTVGMATAPSTNPADATTGGCSRCEVLVRTRRTPDSRSLSRRRRYARGASAAAARIRIRPANFVMEEQPEPVPVSRPTRMATQATIKLISRVDLPSSIR